MRFPAPHIRGEPTLLADPATAEELGTVPEMGLAETKEAIDAASKAFKTWSKTTAKVGVVVGLPGAGPVVLTTGSV